MSTPSTASFPKLHYHEEELELPGKDWSSAGIGKEVHELGMDITMPESKAELKEGERHVKKPQKPV